MSEEVAFAAVKWAAANLSGSYHILLEYCVPGQHFHLMLVGKHGMKGFGDDQSWFAWKGMMTSVGEALDSAFTGRSEVSEHGLGKD